MAEKEIDLRSEAFDKFIADQIECALNEGLDPRQAIAVLFGNIVSLTQFTLAHGKWTYQQAAGIFSQSMLNAIRPVPVNDEESRIQIASADEIPTRKN